MQNYRITETNRNYFEKLGKVLTEGELDRCPSQIKSMQCWNHRVNGGYVLQSYNTLVGYLDDTTNTFYEFGKYSTSTSKQVTTFCRMMGVSNRVLM